jgi:hypothetical protein
MLSIKSPTRNQGFFPIPAKGIDRRQLIENGAKSLKTFGKSPGVRRQNEATPSRRPTGAACRKSISDPKQITLSIPIGKSSGSLIECAYLVRNLLSIFENFPNKSCALTGENPKCKPRQLIDSHNKNYISFSPTEDSRRLHAG